MPNQQLTMHEQFVFSSKGSNAKPFIVFNEDGFLDANHLNLTHQPCSPTSLDYSTKSTKHKKYIYHKKKHKNRIISHQQRTENTPKVIQNSNSDNSAKEQKVLPFCFLPRAQARLRLLRLASCHRSTAQSLLDRCEMMSSAAKEAKCSRLVGMDVRRCLGSWWLTGVFVF